MKVPSELSPLFKAQHFANYPFVQLPQEFEDERGKIANIADGLLGDVAVIVSVKNSIRANHVHKMDWHLSYMLSGAMNYIWKDDEDIEKVVSVVAGEMIYSPPGVPHKMFFLEESTFIAVSAKTRASENYEEDTQRLSDDYFEN
jgi:uncharacterized RmlC-like cupin family protein